MVQSCSYIDNGTESRIMFSARELRFCICRCWNNAFADTALMCYVLMHSLIAGLGTQVIMPAKVPLIKRESVLMSQRNKRFLPQVNLMASLCIVHSWHRLEHTGE